jgi:hypothetical protein
VQLVTVGDAHEVAVPRGLELRLPNQISNPTGKGSELPMEYLWDLYSVWITIEMAGGKLIFSAVPYLACQLSVQKVVPTLTSTSAEIYLSMVGAKKLGDTRFILIPAGALRLARVCSRHCIVLHRDACRGGIQARWERRGGLQVPEV